MATLVDFFEMIFHAIEFVFQIQADFWDEFGVFPTFMLMFIAAVFFRYIILRMFGAVSAGASDSVIRGHDE